MLPFAPITRLIDWITTDDVWRELKRQTPSPIGWDAVTVARSEIGACEFGGNNSGPDVERFRDGHGGHGSWCAAFVYWCLSESAKSLSRPMPFKRTHGARKLFRRAATSGWLVGVQDVQAGDLVLWARGRKSWQGHIGIVSSVMRDERGKVESWCYIAGNEGRYPAPVKERRGEKKKRRIGFARLG